MGRLGIILVFCLALAILCLRFFFFFHNQPEYHDGQNIIFETTLLSEPQRFNTQQRIYANLDAGKRVFITTSLYPQFHYADNLVIEGSLKERRFENNNLIWTMSYPKIEVVKNTKNLFLAVPSFIRKKAISLFEKALPPTSSGLLLGIVFGVKESLPADFSDSLRISGVFHVVAASGMNVTMVGGFLSSLFGWFFRRQLAILLSIGGICLYAVLAGFDPPIVRASIMGILVFTARILGRQTLSLYGLFLAAFAMLMWSPSLVSDIGFQLSFMATLGLLFIQPILEGGKNLKKLINNSILGEGAVTTISAQASTLPILLSNFGLYSLWSVAANSLVLWTIPGLMVIGGMGAIIGMIIPALGSLILYFSLPFLLYFEQVIMFFGKTSGVIDLQNIQWQFTIGYYCLLSAFIIFFSRKG